MDDEIKKHEPKVLADNQSIAIGEINILGNVTGNITIGHTIVQPADARLRHELGILLKNVQTTWIQGVLEKSVHEAALLELGLELREEAVDNPWRMVMEAPDQTRETLPRGRRIKDIFDEANRLLLILGEPGSGKTTTLLQLARDLIAEVDDAFTQPVPVILNLSTWTNKAQPLDEWLVAELNSKYRLPKKDGQRWLKERRILPLLDGLDEVKAENRAACVEKLNQLVTDYGLQGLAVCSRIKDYTALDVRLAFYRAIYIEPLTSEQVDEYLNRAGDKLASLRATLQNDEALRNMAQSPLILNIMSLAYQNTSAGALNDPMLNTNEVRRKHLFDTYIARMFIRKASARQYEDEQTKQRLSWLAQNMQRHNQDMSLIEGLQPSWLSTHQLQWLYIIASRLIIGMMIAAIFRTDFYDVNDRSISIIANLIAWIMCGLSIGIPIGAIDILRFELLRKKMDRGRFPVFWESAVNTIVVGVIVAVTFDLMNNLGIDLIRASLFQGSFVSYIISTSGAVGLIVALLLGFRGSRQNLQNDIQTNEAMRWSWQKAFQGGPIGAIVGIIFFGLVEPTDGRLIDVLLGLLFVGLLPGAMIGAFFKGLSKEIIETKSSPNQGILLSIRNAFFAGLIIGLVIGLIGVLLSFGDLSDALNTMLSGVLIGGLIGALYYGGFDVIQHYALRLLLVLQGHTPADYARFLDYAVDRIFLQKVGGGYRFIHRLLLEHFAEMGEVKRG